MKGGWLVYGTILGVRIRHSFRGWEIRYTEEGGKDDVIM